MRVNTVGSSKSSFKAYAIALKQNFRLDQRVYEVFTVYKDILGNIKMTTSKESGEKKGCIYAIWNVVTKMTYIGKTDQLFKKRISQHVYCVNHHDPENERSKFYQALGNDPENFRFGILVHAAEDLEKEEMEEIKKIPLKFRLNSNIGGGGGTSPSKAKIRRIFAKTKPKVLETPQKYYPLKIKAQKVSFDLTPGIAKSTDAIYVIQNKINKKRYIGFTGQSVQNRLAQHAHKANRKRGLFTTQNLYQDMKEHPNHFQVGILAKDVSPEALPSLEKKIINKKRSYTEGYNCNKGGGGSITSKKIKI